MIALWIGLALAAAPCDLEAPPDARFQVPVDAERVRVVFELWVQGAPDGWAAQALDALDARGAPAMIVVPPGVPDPAVAPLLARADEGPHDVAVALPAELVPRGEDDPVAPVKRAIAPIRKAAGGLKTVVAPIGARVVEAKLGQAGFHSLIDPEGAPTGSPRMAGVFEGMQRINVVLPAGPYEDACGPDPRVGPFTPKAADRAATAIQRANRAEGTPVVRVALLGSRSSTHDAEVLGRWIDTIIIPGKVRVVTAEEARLAALRNWRNPGAEPPPDDRGGGRLVAIDEVKTAAAALAEGEVLPRTLPGDLDLSEAFLAMLLLVAEKTEGPVVRLGAIAGPAQLAQTTLVGPTELSVEGVRALAKSLVAALPDEVPAAISVDGKLLTASELLLALASVVRGESPAVTRPISVPEPNQRGLGWGASTVP